MAALRKVDQAGEQHTDVGEAVGDHVLALLEPDDGMGRTFSSSRSATRGTVDRALAEFARRRRDRPADEVVDAPASRPASLLEVVDLRRAHDFRHTFSAWLEDIPEVAQWIWSGLTHTLDGRA